MLFQNWRHNAIVNTTYIILIYINKLAKLLLCFHLLILCFELLINTTHIVM